MLVIDFETASEVDIRQTGGWAYAQHPSTVALMMAHADAEGGPVRVWQRGQPFPDIDPAQGIVAHNVEFELAIWAYVVRREFPHVKPFRVEHAHDTMALLANAGFPRSLEEGGAALQLTTQKQAAAGKRAIDFWSKLLPGEKPKSPLDFPEKWAEFVGYCVADVETTRELLAKLPALSPKERAIFLEHLRINVRGLRADISRVAKLQTVCQEAEAQLTAGPDGKLLSRPQALVSYLSILGTEVPNAEAENLEAALPNASPAAKDLITKRLEFAKASTKKYKKILATRGNDGRLRGLHVYFGVHIGRWSGSGVQPQNLIRACVKDIDYNVRLLDSLPAGPAAAVAELGGPGDALRWASWMVRPMLLASPGKLLVGSDFSSIEARELAWLVDAARLMEIYRAGGDPYRDMAAFIYKMPYDSIAKDSHERWVGKQSILGDGYGMGWRKFLEYCAAQGVFLTEDEARQATASYRELNPEIPAAWKAIDQTCAIVLQEHNWDKGRFLFKERIILWVVTHNRSPVALCCRLPSGRIISWKYPKYIRIPSNDPEREDEQTLTYLTTQKGVAPAGSIILARIAQLKEKHKIALDPKPYLQQCTTELDGFTRVTTWGGKIIENIIQATSRDVLAEAMLRVAEAGYPIVLHVHDELVPEVPDASHKAEIERLMSIVPDWNAGAVISVEAWCGERYRK